MKNALSTNHAAPRQTQASRSATMRTRILTAAIHVLSGQGYSAATVKTIAAAAGVSVGALQYQFASKANLMAAVIDQLFKARVATYRKGVKDASLEQGIDVLVRATWQVTQEPEFLAMIEIALARRSDEELRRETERAFRRVEYLLERWSMRLWRRYHIPPAVTGTGRRLHSALLTGLAIRMASGLEKNADSLLGPWDKVLRRFIADPGLQALLAADDR